MNNKLKNHYEAFYGLPNEVTFCKSCVISNQRPSSTVEFKHKIDEKKEVINFNTQNICSACEYHSKKKNIDWKQREELLRNLCREIKKKKLILYNMIVLCLVVEVKIVLLLLIY